MRSWAPRTRFAFAAGRYAATLTPVQRDAWRAAAPTGLSGLNLYVAVQSARLAAGLDLLDDVTEGGTLPPLATPTDLLRPSANTLSLEGSSAPRDDAAFGLWVMSPPLQPQDSYFGRFDRLTWSGLLPADAGPYTWSVQAPPAWSLVTGRLLLIGGVLVDVENRTRRVLGSLFEIPAP